MRFSETHCQTGFEHYLTHTTEPTASSKWLGSMLWRGWGGGGPKALYFNKSLLLLRDPNMRLVGLHIIHTAVNPSSSHGNSELGQTMTQMQTV